MLRLVSRALFADFCFALLATASRTLKFDLIGYMPYLCQILTSKPQKSSHDILPRFLIIKFRIYKFYPPRPTPQKRKFKNVRRDSAVAPLERAVGLERAWERKGRRFVSSTPFLSRRKEKGGYKRELFCFTTLTTAKQSVIQAPSPLTRKIKFNAQHQI